MKSLFIAIAIISALIFAPAVQAESVDCTCQQVGLGSCDSTFISDDFIVCTQANAHKNLDGCVPLIGVRGALQCLDQGNIQIDEWTPLDVDSVTPTQAAEAESQSAVGTGRGVLKNPLAGRTVPGLIGQVVAWFGTAGGALFFLYLLWGGVQWMTAGGDQSKTKAAQQRIVAAVAGIAVMMFAYIMVASIIGIVPQ